MSGVISAEELTKALQPLKAAVKTLERKGYAYHGGEEWKPPLGKMPDYLLQENKPESLNIMGVPFRVVYCKEISEIAPDKRSIEYGNSSLEKQEIRIFDGGAIEFTWQTIMHEVLHMIGDMTKISILCTDSVQKHNELDCLTNVLTDTLFRNNLFSFQAGN